VIAILSKLVRNEAEARPDVLRLTFKKRNDSMHYNRVEEILLDDSFYFWYLQTDATEVKRWNEWRLADPANSRLLEEAVAALHSLLNQQDEEGFPRRIHAVYSRLQQARLEKERKEGKEPLPENRADIPDWGKFDIHLS
jgi:hypothetical protein